MVKTNGIVMLGDSRFEWGNWPALLSRCDISNCGAAGDTTAGILQRIASAVPNDHVTCVIQAGVNDIANGETPETVLGNCQRILSYLLRVRHARVILTSIILAGRERAGLNDNISECNRALSQLADEMGVDWLDLNAALSPGGKLAEEYSEDGVHLNGNGYEQLCRALVPFLPVESTD